MQLEVDEPKPGVDFRNGNPPDGILNGPGPSIYGQELNNPYEISNIKTAANALGITFPPNVPPTHVYLKMNYTDWAEVAAMADFEEEHDYEFDTDPLHREILYDGEEPYIDSLIPENTPQPEYGAITYDDYQNLTIPVANYEVLDQMIIPPYESRLTFAAYVISGNETKYEAIDGNCHPDCPAWPKCLEDESLTCDPNTAAETLPETVDPGESANRRNFPAYILDSYMGYDGEFDSQEICLEVNPPTEPDCGLGCTAYVFPLPSNPSICEWRCNCPPPPPPPGSEPPPGQVSRCGCNVFENKKRPGGVIKVNDTQLGEEAVRRIKVKTTLRWFGFRWEDTDTDDNGCWKIDRKYNVRGLKIRIVFKDRVSDRHVIRAIRGARFWNAFLKPVKYTWLVRSTSKTWNNQCLTIFQDGDESSIHEQTYVAAITNNGVHEHYDFTNLPSPGNFSILIHDIDEGLNAAPMFEEIDEDDGVSFPLTLQYIYAFSENLTEAILISLLTNYIEVSKPDVFLHFGEEEPSDQKRRVVYHEMAHVSQYAILGQNWWRNNLFYIVEGFEDGEVQPYGEGFRDGAGRTAIIEGLAETVEHLVSDEKYGLLHSNNGVGQAGRYLNRGEILLFWNGSNTPFIPEGLFFDLLDDNMAATDITTNEPPDPADPLGATFLVEDECSGYTLLQLFDALNLAPTNINEYRQDLIQTAGIPIGCPEFDAMNDLYDSYGF
ncbi:hypothetical protein CEQ90_04555 [Lewinellaceae bacterium SD302]|nr:hypothetical protein CEQ90_04555 [Lewinellaceae bacterium SD302]